MARVLSTLLATPTWQPFGRVVGGAVVGVGLVEGTGAAVVLAELLQAAVPIATVVKSPTTRTE
jgi:hypothetical protein